MQNHIDITQWKELFSETGLDQAMMDKWHHLFETKYPDAHQSFLQWLGLPQEKIVEIRSDSK